MNRPLWLSLASLVGASLHTALMPVEWEPRLTVMLLCSLVVALGSLLYRLERRTAALVQRAHLARTATLAAVQHCWRQLATRDRAPTKAAVELLKEAAQLLS